MGSEVEEIRERLAGVESSMRHYRAALAVVGLIAAAGLVGPSLVGPTKGPGTVRANRFEVVDDNGGVRASLATEGDSADLFLYDKAGTGARTWEILTSILLRPARWSIGRHRRWCCSADRSGCCGKHLNQGELREC